MSSLTWKYKPIPLTEWDETKKKWVLTGETGIFHELQAFYGNVCVGIIAYHTASADDANHAPGSLISAEVRTGPKGIKFPKRLWVALGYTWRNDYIPALANLDEPKAYIEKQWEKFASLAGIA